jgi:hypothetical protein
MNEMKQYVINGNWLVLLRQMASRLEHCADENSDPFLTDEAISMGQGINLMLDKGGIEEFVTFLTKLDEKLNKS